MSQIQYEGLYVCIIGVSSLPGCCLHCQLSFQKPKTVSCDQCSCHESTIDSLKMTVKNLEIELISAKERQKMIQIEKYALCHALATKSEGKGSSNIFYKYLCTSRLRTFIIMFLPSI